MAGSSLSLMVKDLDASAQTRKRKASVKRARPAPKPAASKKRRVTKSKSVSKQTATRARAPKKTTPVLPRVTLGKTGTKPVAKAVTQKELATIKREPLAHLLVEQYLREAGFRGGISTDNQYLDRYATDESIFSIRPQIVIQPKNQRDVELAVRVIAEHTKRFPSLSLTPRAAGTGLSGGSLTDSIVLDVCSHLHHIGEVVEKNNEITITCGPGAMWRNVEKKLAAHGAYIPSYPASKDICSIGGAVANNAAGPDSLRFGHTANWVKSVEIVLRDGNTYTIKPLGYSELKALIKKKNAYAEIAGQVFALIEKHETEIKKAKPKTKKNSAGYPLWDVIDGTVADFKKGKAKFDLTRLISGSQGTIGIITSLTLRAEPIALDTELIAVPVFDLASAGSAVVRALEFNPINIELFDALTYDLALKNPDFFKTRIAGSRYYRVLLSMYTAYHIRYRRRIPEFTLLVTIDAATAAEHGTSKILASIRAAGCPRARIIKNPIEREMLWQVRRASYSLSKFQDPNKRPAAFLEDMTVPPEHLAKFFLDIKKLLKKFNVTAAVHGHGGNGHFHFYPLLDFTSQATPPLVEKMAEEFFATAIKYGGNLCGEHNDGIIRTPHLSKMFNKKTLELFKQLEHIFDPDDIFNPGKKVNPRFDIKETMRKTN